MGKLAEGKCKSGCVLTVTDEQRALALAAEITPKLVASALKNR